jgi:hypothetical protein
MKLTQTQIELVTRLVLTYGASPFTWGQFLSIRMGVSPYVRNELNLQSVQATGVITEYRMINARAYYKVNLGLFRTSVNDPGTIYPVVESGAENG